MSDATNPKAAGCRPAHKDDADGQVWMKMMNMKNTFHRLQVEGMKKVDEELADYRKKLFGEKSKS